MKKLEFVCSIPAVWLAVCAIAWIGTGLAVSHLS